jgi:8-oxo-dGTP diphosphatase
LLGKRKDSGLYGLPGGWLEKYEEWNECASRELKEETGLDLNRKRFHCVETLNCKRLEDNYHAISLIMYTEIEENEKVNISNLEPNKCEKWLWVSFSQLRINLKRLFYPLQDFLNKYPQICGLDQLRKLVHFKKSDDDSKMSNKHSTIPLSKGSIVSMSASCDDSTFEGDSVITKEDLLLDYTI